MRKKQKYCFKNFHFILGLLKNHILNHILNLNLLHEIPFYDKLSIQKISKAFKNMKEVIKLK